MSQHILDHRALVSSPELLRTGFHAESSSQDGAVVIRLRGELDVATSVELRRVLAQALEEKPRDLVFDLADLSFVDSTGIGVLVGACRRAEEANCSFVLRSPARSVLKALRLTGIDRLVPIDQPESN